MTHMKENQILARGQMYKLLSMALSYPDESLKIGLNSSLLATKLAENVEELRGYGLKDLAKSVQKTFEKYGDNPFQGMESEYLGLFGQEHNSKCTPYELEYLKGPLFMKTGELADIAGFYKAFGLEVSNANRVRLDHISTELEFMYFITLKEAYAMTNGTPEEQEICRNTQKKFLTDHLGRWTGVFHEEIKKNGGSEIYTNLSLLVDKFITRDSEKLGANPEKKE